jgi:hypothetical protein
MVLGSKERQRENRIFGGGLEDPLSRKHPPSRGGVNGDNTTSFQKNTLNSPNALVIVIPQSSVVEVSRFVVFL